MIGGIYTAKQGMSRPNWTHTQPRNDKPAVPEIQGKAKHGNAKARPIIAGTAAPEMKVYHSKPHSDEAELYPGYDTDLAVDNLENDLPEADKRNS